MSNAIFAVAGMLVLLVSICGFTIPGTGPQPTPTPHETPVWTPTPEVSPTPAHTSTPRPSPTHIVTPTPQPTALAGKVSLPNGDFETGTYDHWSVEDEGFGTAPSNLDYENAQGTFFVGEYTHYRGRYAASSFIPKHDAGSIGTLTSDEFTITKPYLEFLITGMENAQLYLEVWVDGAPVKHYMPDNPTTDFERVSLDLTPWLGKQAYVTIVDSTPNRPFGYIEVDDFYLTAAPTATPS